MAKRPILNRKAFRKSMRRHAVMSLAALMVTQNAMAVECLWHNTLSDIFDILSRKVKRGAANGSPSTCT